MRFLVDLGMHRKENVPNARMGSLPIPECYEALEAHETVWRDLAPSRCDDDLALFHGLEFASMDGLLAEMIPHWDSHGAGSLHLIQLPSVLGNAGLREWTLPNLDFMGWGFAMDPEQDLLLWVVNDLEGRCILYPC